MRQQAVAAGALAGMAEAVLDAPVERQGQAGRDHHRAKRPLHGSQKLVEYLRVECGVHRQMRQIVQQQPRQRLRGVRGLRRAARERRLRVRDQLRQELDHGAELQHGHVGLVEHRGVQRPPGHRRDVEHQAVAPALAPHAVDHLVRGGVAAQRVLDDVNTIGGLPVYTTRVLARASEGVQRVDLAPRDNIHRRARLLSIYVERRSEVEGRCWSVQFL